MLLVPAPGYSVCMQCMLEKMTAGLTSFQYVFRQHIESAAACLQIRRLCGFQSLFTLTGLAASGSLYRIERVDELLL
jgi:hypothetical protein